jgi:hypothetical protein
MTTVLSGKRGVVHLSFVFTVSHLTYGGDFCNRVQNCLANLHHYGRAHLDAEVVITELEGAGVYESVKQYRDLPTRVITVPRAIHNGLPNPHNESFFEYIMKDVGIRRAYGDFILSTNPDNLYSPELIDRLVEGKLDSSCFYRVDRSDVRDGKVFQVNKNTGTYFVGGGSTEGELTHGDPNGLHFNASGDFILAHRNAWADIKGHPEVPYSLSVDGQTVYLLAKHGYKQVILPEPMYHADHSRTPKFSPAWSDKAPYAEKQNGNDWGLQGYELATVCL